MISIHVQDGSIRLACAEALRRLHGRLAAVHKEMGEALLTYVQEGFAGEHAPDGTAWAPLAARTVKRRGSAHPILRVKGRLAHLYSRASAEGAVIGTNVPYARIHQHGGVVQHKGGTTTIHMKKIKSGPRKGKVRFAKAGAAGARAREVSVGPYEVRIPARPFLFNPDGGIPPQWQDALQRILTRELQDALGKEGR